MATLEPKLTIENETILWMLFEQDEIGMGQLKMLLHMDVIEISDRYQEYCAIYGTAVKERMREMEAYIADRRR